MDTRDTILNMIDRRKTIRRSEDRVDAGFDWFSHSITLMMGALIGFLVTLAFIH